MMIITIMHGLLTCFDMSFDTTDGDTIRILIHSSRSQLIRVRDAATLNSQLRVGKRGLTLLRSKKGA